MTRVTMGQEMLKHLPRCLRWGLIKETLWALKDYEADHPQRSTRPGTSIARMKYISICLVETVIGRSALSYLKGDAKRRNIRSTDSQYYIGDQNLFDTVMYGVHLWLKEARWILFWEVESYSPRAILTANGLETLGTLVRERNLLLFNLVLNGE